MINDLTILIQGRCEEKQLNLWIKNYSEWNVIISTWKEIDDNIIFPKNWKIIKSNYPPRYYSAFNFDYHLESTIIGLNYVNTKYVLKLRADEYWSNIDVVYNKFKKDDTKVLCGSLFFRPLDTIYPFHISDHIICSTLDNMIKMFVGAKNNIKLNLPLYAPESILGFGFVSNKENFNKTDCVKYIKDSKFYLQKWFDIIDVNELTPFIATYSSKLGRHYIIDYFSNFECITKF